MIDIIKLLTGETEEALLNYWIDKACIVIKEYLKRDLGIEEIKKLYKDAVIQLVVDEQKKYTKDKKYGSGVVSFSQGERSINFNVESAVTGKITLTSEVKALLPKPLLRMV